MQLDICVKRESWTSSGASDEVSQTIGRIRQSLEPAWIPMRARCVYPCPDRSAEGQRDATQGWPIVITSYYVPESAPIDVADLEGRLRSALWRDARIRVELVGGIARIPDFASGAPMEAGDAELPIYRRCWEEPTKWILRRVPGTDLYLPSSLDYGDCSFRSDRVAEAVCRKMHAAGVRIVEGWDGW